MQLLDEVRANCAAIARDARCVSIDLDAWSEPPSEPDRRWCSNSSSSARSQSGKRNSSAR